MHVKKEAYEKHVLQFWNVVRGFLNKTSEEKYERIPLISNEFQV
jgi:hypothetical protein